MTQLKKESKNERRCDTCEFLKKSGCMYSCRYGLSLFIFNYLGRPYEVWHKKIVNTVLPYEKGE